MTNALALSRNPKESSARFQSRQKKENRRAFKAWRDKNGLSYQDIVDRVNEKVGIPVLKYPTCASWGVRGARPGKAISEAIKEAFPDCPLI